MTDRCTGHCCRAFYLPFSPEELQHRYKDLMDGETIYEMVKCLGFFKQKDLGIWPDDPRGERDGYFYTCKNLQPNGDCGIYETRPYMCRDYPYGIRCGYAACTWGEARHLQHPEERERAFLESIQRYELSECGSEAGRQGDGVRYGDLFRQAYEAVTGTSGEEAGK